MHINKKKFFSFFLLQQIYFRTIGFGVRSMVLEKSDVTLIPLIPQKSESLYFYSSNLSVSFVRNFTGVQKNSAREGEEESTQKEEKVPIKSYLVGHIVVDIRLTLHCSPLQLACFDSDSGCSDQDPCCRPFRP